MRVFCPGDALAIFDGKAKVLGLDATDGPAILGLARIKAEEAESFWERHDGGDGLLIVLRGSMTFTMTEDGKTQSLEAGRATYCLSRAASPTARCCTARR